MPANFFSQLAELAARAHTIDWPTLALGVGSLVLIVAWPKSYQPIHARWRRLIARVPGTIVVMAIGIVAALALDETFHRDLDYLER
jgi:SulP family sulfate permease